MSLAGMTGPVLVSDRMALPSVTAVETWMWPPITLWRAGSSSRGAAQDVRRRARGAAGHRGRALIGRSEPGEEVVEGVVQVFELFVGVVEGEPLTEVAGRDPPGGGGDAPDRSQQPAGDVPAEQDGEQGDDGQGDFGVDEKAVEV